MISSQNAGQVYKDYQICSDKSLDQLHFRTPGKGIYEALCKKILSHISIMFTQR